MAKFEQAVQRTLKLEGGYSDQVADKGGKTMFGITEVKARAHGFKGEMRDLPLELAKQIYKKDYWDFCRLDEVNSQLIAENIFDMSVLCGPGITSVTVQRTLNVINVNEKNHHLWPDLLVDGIIGNLTISALNMVTTPGLEAVNPKFMEDLFIKVFNSLRGARYVQIAEGDKTQKQFMHGWGSHRLFVDPRR